MGRHLTNQEVYNYFKDRSIAKSRKLSGVIAKNCISLEFMGDLVGPDSDVFQEKFPKYLRTADEHVNSESVEKQFGQADVYDSTESILHRHRVPGSRAKCKDNARGSRGELWKGQSEVNRTESVDNPGEIDNYHAQEVVATEGR